MADITSRPGGLVAPYLGQIAAATLLLQLHFLLLRAVELEEGICRLFRGEGFLLQAPLLSIFFFFLYSKTELLEFYRVLVFNGV